MIVFYLLRCLYHSEPNVCVNQQAGGTIISLRCHNLYFNQNLRSNRSFKKIKNKIYKY